MKSKERGSFCARSLILIFVFLCFPILSSSPAFAASPVFGPETYTRATGEPITETDTFTVSDPGAPHWLTITNGDQGEHQVTSGWVWVNGILEVHPSDFNPHVGRIKKRITLTATTTISVRLAGAPDSFLSLEIGKATGCLPMQFAGPWTFTRQTGPPRTETRNFSIEHPNNHYLLRILNGDENGGHRVSSGWVWVNNVQIAQPSDFNQQVETIEREVTLQQQNELKVKLASTPGAFITVSVLGDNIGAPTIQILVPQDGEINRTGTVDVSGSVSADTVTVLVNGVSAAILDATTFLAIGIPLPVPGANPIAATAYDACGRSATDTISVTYEPLPALAVQITSPQEGATLSTLLANVSGTISDDTALVTANGVTAAVANGGFSATDVPLTPGLNTLTVTAVRGSETATDSVNVNLLTLSIASPTEGQAFTDEPITVTGEVSLAEAVVFVNGATGTVTGTTFTATNVPLLTGAQELIAYATHNGTTAQSPPITVTLSALGVTITSPMAGQTFAADTITVTGTVTRSTASVTVNGVNAAVNPTEHTFTAENVPLTPGATTLTAQATAGTETVHRSCGERQPAQGDHH